MEAAEKGVYTLAFALFHPQLFRFLLTQVYDMYDKKVVRRIFTERARIVVYLESEEIDRMLAVAKASGMTLVEWAREALRGELQNNGVEDVPRNRKVRVDSRRAMPNGSGTVGESEVSATTVRDAGVSVEHDKTCQCGVCEFRRKVIDGR